MLPTCLARAMGDTERLRAEEEPLAPLLVRLLLMMLLLMMLGMRKLKLLVRMLATMLRMLLLTQVVAHDDVHDAGQVAAHSNCFAG